jgi:hypothetical protein
MAHTQNKRRKQTPELNHNKDSQKRDPLTRLSTLVELFYGFSIANGLADALKSTIEHNSMLQLGYFMIALVMAIADWLGYHIHVSPIPYRSVVRLLLDLLFPMILYCLLVAPGIYPAKDGINTLTLIFILAYFSFALFYCLFLFKEHPESDRRLLWVIGSCMLLSVASLLIDLLGQRYFHPAVSDIIATAAVGTWAGFNIYLLGKAMKQQKPA